jgi:hypothetical protein
MSAYSEKIQKLKTGYFRTADFEILKELTLTIDYLAEDVEVFDKVKDVLFFRDDGRQLEMNLTNSETLIKILGDEPAKWGGQKITLYLTTYPAKNGDPKPCIRIRPPGNVVPINAPTRTIERPAAERAADRGDLDDEIPF